LGARPRTIRTILKPWCVGRRVSPRNSGTFAVRQPISPSEFRSATEIRPDSEGLQGTATHHGLEIKRILSPAGAEGCYAGAPEDSMPADHTRPPTDLAARDPHAALTVKELATLVDGLVDNANRNIRQSEALREGVADDLFREAFGNKPALVLDEAPSTRVYRELAAHAGVALRLSPGELEDYVRVGALNQRLEADGRWDKLDFSDKLALAPLTVLEDRMKTFHEGLAAAMLPSMRSRALSAWVRKKLPAAGPAGRPEGLTFRGRGQLTDGGLRLADPERRARFAGQFRKAPAQTRRRFLKELRDAHRSLGLLLEELGKPADG